MPTEQQLKAMRLERDRRQRMSAALVTIGWQPTVLWGIHAPSCAEANPHFPHYHDSACECRENITDALLLWLYEQHLVSFHFGEQAGEFYVDWGEDGTHEHRLRDALATAVCHIAADRINRSIERVMATEKYAQ